MKKELTENEALLKAEAYCSVAEHCRAEVVTKLYQWGVQAASIETVVSRLEKEGFVDNLRDAKAFVRDKYRFNQWGRIKILQALRQKQVSSTDISLAMEEIDEEEYADILDHLLAKKQKTIKAGNAYERNGKLIRFAVGRGYEMNEVLRGMKRIGCDDESFD